ncbi:unnamed protein product [Rhodiola kirilowii]
MALKKHRERTKTLRKWACKRVENSTHHHHQGHGPTLLQRDQNQGQQYQTQAQRPYQQVEAPPQSSNEPSGVEAMFAQILAQQERSSRDFQAKIEGLQTHVKMLENQIAQQAESYTRALGKLPARPEHEKKEFCNAVYIEGSFDDELLECEFLESEEQCGAVTLRSGRHLEGTIPKKTVQIPPKPVGQARAEEKELNEEVPNPQTEKAKEGKERKEELKPYSPPVPFPQRLLKVSKLDKDYEVFTKMLKKLYVYIPFHELIKKAPPYNKFLKEILSKKRTIEEDDHHPLDHECSALFSRQMPQKVGDPGKFTIPCSIGDMSFSSPLANLGASAPLGLVENVPIKVDKFYIPCDFVVIDMGENFTSSLILGHPFLATAGFKVDVGKGKLTLKIGGEKVKIGKPREEQVANVEAKLEKEGIEIAKGEKVDKKMWKNMIEPDEDPPIDQYESPPGDGISKIGQESASKGEKIPSWRRAIKQVACNSSKNPD